MKKIIVSITIVLVFFLSYAIWTVCAPVGRGHTPIYFSITVGQSFDDILNNLMKDDLIKNKLVFKIYAKLKGLDNKMVAGDHVLDKSMNAKTILNSLTINTNPSNEKTITVIEGWQVKEIAEYLERRGVVSSDEFLSAIKTDDWRDQYDFLIDVKAKTLEGFLFPDTYRIFTNATAQDIVKKMLDNFNSKLITQMRQDIKKQNKNIFEVVILASIVEREVPNDGDKKMIADIFLKRLVAGIALQSDATINYVTGKGQAQPSYDDLQVDSPYNTYKYRGLPPGPISNPGIKSIEAVIYPMENTYYYFLTTLDDGKVIYSKTYEEHLVNKAKYLD